MDEKTTGSYYTPRKLIEYMIAFIRKKADIIKILEPSAGDGRFVEALCKFNYNIHAIEIDRVKSKHLKERQFENTQVTSSDFIEYALTHEENYDLIIGNPPYISKRNLFESNRQLSYELMEYFALPDSLFQNLWVSFILASIKLLASNGSIFFVLPFEFLQVQYSEKLRNYLETRFNSIEIITFEEKIFDHIEQDVCLVYLSNENNLEPFIRYTTIKNLTHTEPIFESTIMRNKPLTKWSNCILNDIETEMLKTICDRYPKIREFGDISPGIVTGANDFFILNQEMARKLRDSENDLQIISKSSDLANKLLFTSEDYDALLIEKKKVILLDLNNLKENNFSTELKQYLKSGEDKEISKRYKCSKRKRWYDVPIIKRGEVCFFKRYNLIPRVIINQANVFTTDIAYNIRFHQNIDKASFAFCFYNSLTLVLCEYNGRFYGGGVGELVPNEFKDLHLPYCEVSYEQVMILDSMFRQKCDYLEIVDYVDSVVLNLSDDQKQDLQNIRNRYLKRRLKQ
ncbi:N-6 DNA methylase [Acetobacterium paludosum]|uniref:site-specific DNA-methyltransferase (adenine-specific) n=1 Tax=Acetobacterium paludosum TaxID=52693 RepID=A0A923HXG7_9FIRM|nr:N-6 DNA methylase [Acetobacterium paludosum]MBC3888429.1 N-6 DNA methylase [Acetobacterium paludosum]